MDTALLRTALTVNWQNLALGHEVIPHRFATFVRNRSLPLIYDANFVFGIRAADAPALTQVLADLEREYAHAYQLTIRTDPFTPPIVDAWLLANGWTCEHAVLLLLTGAVTARAWCDVRPVVTPSDWSAYAALKQLNATESVPALVGDELAAVIAGLVTASQAKCPPVEYALAYRGGQPVGFCSAWGGLDGVGQVEDLFVHRAHRKQGVATALLEHCVTRARAAGAGPVALVVHPTNTARRMYLALGWEPIAACHQYGRRCT
jgi:GNAT superfamily N-acetyltransferase